MAIPANQFPNKSQTDRDVERFETRIDTVISANWSISSRPLERVEVELYHYFEQNETHEPQVLRRLKAIYEAAGWRAEILDKGGKTLLGLGAFEHKYYIVISKE